MNTQLNLKAKKIKRSIVTTVYIVVLLTVGSCLLMLGSCNTHGGDEQLTPDAPTHANDENPLFSEDKNEDDLILTTEENGEDDEKLHFSVEESEDGWILYYEFIGDEGGDDEGSGRHITEQGSSAVYVERFLVNIVDNRFSCFVSTNGKNAGISSFYYGFSNDILYIKPLVDYMPDYAKDDMLNIKIEDERLRKITTVVLWDELDERRKTIWDINGYHDEYEWIPYYEFIGNEEGNGPHIIQQGSIASTAVVSFFASVVDDRFYYEFASASSYIGFSNISYRFSDGTMYIRLLVDMIPDYAELGYADIVIEDEGIREITSVVLWGENYEKDNEVLWGKNNGYSVKQQARVEDISSIDVRVGDGYIEYEGLVISDTWGYVGCRYKIVNGNQFRVLYIQPYVNLLPDFAEDGRIDVRIENACIDNNIGRVVLGFEDDENKITIWNNEDGFLGAEGIKESFDNSLGFSVGGYRKR
jgi:hypothetical protein